MDLPSTAYPFIIVWTMYSEDADPGTNIYKL